MTEEEWLECGVPSKLLNFLRFKSSDRKVRLFAASCCRRLWHSLADAQVRKIVDALERYAENAIVRSTMEKWYRKSKAVLACLHIGEDLSPEILANCAVEYATRPTLSPDDYLFGWDMMVAPCIVAPVRVNYSDTNFYSAANREMAIISRLIKDIFGNPFRPVSLNPAWLTPTVTNLAQAAYDERALPSGELDPARLAVLSDALEEAGCYNNDILNHLRSPGPHVRGCWAVDLILDKE